MLGVSIIGIVAAILVISIFIIVFTKKRQNKITDKDIYDFFENISFSTSTGGDIQSALDYYIKNNSSIKMMPVVKTIYKDMASGMKFNKALKKHAIFSSFICAMIKVGEEGGRLNEILEQLSADIEQKMDIKRMLSNNMVGYVILGIVVLILIIISTIVMHTFKEIFSQMDMTLPLVSRISLSISDFLINHWILVTGGLASGFIGIKTYLANNKRVVDLYKFKVPVFGPIYKNFIIYHLTKTYYLLINNGIEPVSALELIGNIIDNIHIKDLINDVLKRVRRGERIVLALEEENKKMCLLDKDMFFLLKSGEANSNVDISFFKTSERYRKTLLNQTKLIETKIKWPIDIFLILIGLWMWVSVMQPAFSMGSASMQLMK